MQFSTFGKLAALAILVASGCLADQPAAGSGADSSNSKPESNTPSGSVYVPLDSWIYPALRRLADWGFVPDQVSGQAPWTRAECMRQVEQAAHVASNKADSNSPIMEQVLRLIADIRSALAPESETDNMIRLESVYSRLTHIAGTPLGDGYHFGTTIANDFGRPYDKGFNYAAGFSSYAVSGRLSAYVRGEYEYAPGRDVYPLSVRRFIASADGVPLAGAQNVQYTSRFQPLEMYAGVQLGFENISFGKQSLWWGPTGEARFHSATMLRPST